MEFKAVMSSNLVDVIPAKKVIVELPIRPSVDTSKHIVTKSKRLALAKVDFNTTQHKIWNACLAQINPLASYPEGIEILLLREEIAELAGIKLSNVHREARACADKFMDTKFEVLTENRETREDEFEKLNLVQLTRYKNGEFLLILTPIASKELINLQRYGSFNIAHQKNMKSKYCILLHDVLAIYWNNKGKSRQILTVSVQELKFKFGILDDEGNEILKSYEGMKEFKRRVLLVAVNEMNKHNDFTIDVDNIKYLKTGRKITHIELPCTRTKNVSSTSKDLSATERLMAHGLTESEIKEISKAYKKSNLHAFDAELTEEKVINESINFVESKKDVKSFFSYLKSAVIKGYAFLPDWANPFSDMYKKEKPLVKSFVNQILVDEFVLVEEAYADKLISESVYLDIISKGAYSGRYFNEMSNYIKDRQDY